MTSAELVRLLHEAEQPRHYTERREWWVTDTTTHYGDAMRKMQRTVVVHCREPRRFDGPRESQVGYLTMGEDDSIASFLPLHDVRHALAAPVERALAAPYA